MRSFAAKAKSAVALASVFFLGFTPLTASAATPAPKAPATAMAFDNDELDFTLVNRTGFDISRVYFAEGGRTDWDGETEALHGRVLKNNEFVHIHFPPRAHHKIWDMQIVWAVNGTHLTFKDLNLQETHKLTLHYNQVERKVYQEVE
jgi:hypothetical protein